MPELRLSAAMPALLRRRALRIASAVAAAAALAAFASLPAVVRDQDRAGRVESLPTVSLDDVQAMGKIPLRYRGGADDGEDGRQAALLTPASLMMPMTIAWAPVPATGPEPRGAQAVPARSGVSEAALHRPLSPPPRPMELAAARPMQILPSTVPASSAPPAVAEERGLVRLVSAPAARIAGVVTGAAGAMGAAGSWTIAQAASFVPRW